MQLSILLVDQGFEFKIILGLLLFGSPKMLGDLDYGTLFRGLVIHKELDSWLFAH